MKRTTFAAACVLCPALLLAACAPQGAASASAFGDRPPMDESISASLSLIHISEPTRP